MKLAAMLLAVAALAGAARCAAATDPGEAGPFSPVLWQVSIPATRGATLEAHVHHPGDGAGGIPPAAGDCPVVVFGHGFSRTPDRYVDFGRHLASRGYVVIVPDFAGFADHSRNADDLSACVDWALAQDADPTSRFFDRIDAAAVGSSGHSAGGLSSLLAFARDARIVAAAPMDPVDNGDLGVTELPGVGKPVAITYSEDSACNANGSARALYAAASPPKRGVRIVGATHCDPESPSDFLCRLTCGSPAAARQALYRKLVTGWLELHLRCDPAYAPWALGSEMQADVTAGVATYAADLTAPARDVNGDGQVDLLDIEAAIDAILERLPATVDADCTMDARPSVADCICIHRSLPCYEPAEPRRRSTAA